MGLVGPLLAVGIGLLAFGLYYEFFDRVLIQSIAAFIVPNVYYQGSQLIWDSLPYIAIGLAVLCLVGAGVAHSRGESD